MKKYFTAIAVFLFPSFIAVFFLRLLGHKVHRSCKIGFSIVLVPSLSMAAGSWIGHGNIIKCDSISLGVKGRIGKLNVVKGNIHIIVGELSVIGNMNVLSRAALGVTYGQSTFHLGIMSSITSSHKVDLTRSIFIGNYTTFAGQSSQLWTHGYYHNREGPGRFRIDGEIRVGNNVYIGSACLVNAGLTIADGITVGSNSTISKSLTEPGMYVSQPLRFIPSDPVEVEKKLKRVTVENLHEIVYEKEI